jgi:hypothetical protein
MLTFTVAQSGLAKLVRTTKSRRGFLHGGFFAAEVPSLAQNRENWN